MARQTTNQLVAEFARVLDAPKTSHSYYVVMIDFGQRGLEAIVHPENTRRATVEMIAHGEYRNIAFIHHIDGLYIEDVTAELLAEAGASLLDLAEVA